MAWNAKYGLLLLLYTIITWCASLVIEKNKNDKKKIKTVLILSLVLLFGVLFYFKYFIFTVQNVNRICDILGFAQISKNFDIVLPVGISFFAFQSTGYLIDVYRGSIKAEKNFFKYALFVSFFPQLVAGPIERSSNLMKQLEKTYTFDFDRAKSGIILMIYGFFLKLVIADRAAIFVNTVYNNPEEAVGGMVFIIATFFFAIQIYCDFYGYSIIAKGAARILGIELMSNFECPYFATSIKDFWRRWHISLSSWFKDYVYIPLGGSRCSKVRANINIVIVMILSGIWHGAGWHFVAWGALHAVYQVFDRLTVFIQERLPKLLRIIITFCAVNFAWIFFRANSLRQAFYIVKNILNSLIHLSLKQTGLKSNGLDVENVKLLLLCIFVLFVIDFVKYKKLGLPIKISSAGKHISVSKVPAILQICAISFSVIFIVIFGIWGSAYNESSFIYFQF